MTLSLLYTFFGIIFMAYLMLDLFVLNRKIHEPTLKSVMLQTTIAIGITFLFVVALWAFGYTLSATEFMAVYITEKMLSLDNLFVILVIFQFFNISKQYQHRVLFFGIFGAIVFRLVFILAGSALINAIDWVMYLFAIILIWTGYKIMQGKDEDHHEKLKNNKINHFLHTYVPYTEQEHHGKFMMLVNGKWVLTFLAFALIIIETSDIMFALDSIPAAFAITHDPGIIFTANIAAILGLRSLFFAVEWLLERLRYLNYGLGMVLIFIGFKFISTSFLHISSGMSLGIIALILTIVTVLSLYKRKSFV